MLAAWAGPGRRRRPPPQGARTPPGALQGVRPFPLHHTITHHARTPPVACQEERPHITFTTHYSCTQINMRIDTHQLKHQEALFRGWPYSLYQTHHNCERCINTLQNITESKIAKACI